MLLLLPLPPLVLVRERSPWRWERPTICLSEDRAVAMFGFMSRREVRSTACSRNSLANWVCAVREEWPSKAEESSSAVEEGLLERERLGLLWASFRGLLVGLPTPPRPPAVVVVGVAEGEEPRVDG